MIASASLDGCVPSRFRCAHGHLHPSRLPAGEGAKKRALGFSLVQACGLLAVINYEPSPTDSLVQSDMSAWSAVGGARSQADNSLTSQVLPNTHLLAAE
jgi:hypothetical protein